MRMHEAAVAATWAAAVLAVGAEAEVGVVADEGEILAAGAEVRGRVNTEAENIMGVEIMEMATGGTITIITMTTTPRIITTGGVADGAGGGTEPVTMLLPDWRSVRRLEPQRRNPRRS